MSSYCSYAQFNTFSAGHTTTLDYVGIGTDGLPSNGKLQINGSADIISVNNSGAFRIYDGTNFAGGVGTDAWANSGNNLDFAVYAPNNMNIYGGGQKRITILNSGNVGIGTASPASNLEVKGANTFDAPSVMRITNNTGDYGRVGLILTGRIQDANDAWNFGSLGRNAIVFAQNAANSGANIGATGDEKYSIQLEGNTNSLGFLSKLNGGAPNLVLTQSGYVGIGTTIPDAKLAVKGIIHTQEVKVDMAGWGDYVFDKGYPLKPLSSVKSYIDENHHLPEIPSEAEVIKNGVNVGEMLKLQTKKIEELTLYLIDKDKQLSEQNAKLADQQKKNDAQEARIAALEKALLKQTENQSK